MTRLLCGFSATPHSPLKYQVSPTTFLIRVVAGPVRSGFVVLQLGSHVPLGNVWSWQVKVSSVLSLQSGYVLSACGSSCFRMLGLGTSWQSALVFACQGRLGSVPSWLVSAWQSSNGGSWYGALQQVV